MSQAGDENATARVTRASKAGKGGAKGGAGGLCAPTTRSSGRRALGELSTNTGVARSSSVSLATLAGEGSWPRVCRATAPEGWWRAHGAMKPLLSGILRQFRPIWGKQGTGVPRRRAYTNLTQCLLHLAPGNGYGDRVQVRRV